MKGRVYSRTPGSWTITYDQPQDGTGKRRQIQETFKGITKAQAEAKLRERLTARDTGAYIPRAREKVGAFLERWMETYGATNLSLRTQHGYRGYIDRYAIPAFGNTELQKLTPGQVQDLYSKLLERGLSNTTVNQLHRILHKAFSTAVRWGLLARNPTDAVTAPRLERQEVGMWDVETVNRFLAAARESRFCGFYELAVLTGCRRSELCGLKWENVDLAAHRLQVVNTLQRIKGYGLVEGRPKTSRSRRSISLSPQAVDVLHAIRGRQMEQQLAAGPLWHNPQGHVFTQADGTPVAPDMVTKDFSNTVHRAGLPHLSLHGLRHAHATLLLVSGVHAKVVSERLGHSNIAITLDTYSHVIPGLQEEAALALDQKIRVDTLDEAG